MDKNNQYESNGYRYTTNDSGQIIHAEGDLRLEDGKRNPYAQRIAGGDNRHEGDDGGHLIGARFGGSGELDNIVAEDSHINRGAFKTLENGWADSLKDGKNVNVEIDPVYHGESPRPDIITSKTVITSDESVETDYFSVTNENLESEEFELPPEADEMLGMWEEQDMGENAFESATDFNDIDVEKDKSSFDISAEYESNEENDFENSFSSDLEENVGSSFDSGITEGESVDISSDIDDSISDGSDESLSDNIDCSRYE